MTCKGLQADYLCVGWRRRVALIRARDSDRCRGCNRSSEEVRLEVHHRTYGKGGICGSCVLTGVTNDDLTTLCKDCHDAITSTRRRLRYDGREVDGHVLAPSKPATSKTRTRLEVTSDIIPIKPSTSRVFAKRKTVW